MNVCADGTKKAIDVVVGDVVLTTDPETGETVEKRVADTITTEDDKDFTEISISVDGEYSSIVATDTHPFWVPELKKWVKAGDLQLGQTLRTSAGTHVQITALSHYTKRQRTHDLTIEDIHAYLCWRGRRRYSFTTAIPLLLQLMTCRRITRGERWGLLMWGSIRFPFQAARAASRRCLQSSRTHQAEL